MLTFADYGQDLENFLRDTPRPEVQIMYFAYKTGTARSYPTFEAAREYSSIIERVVNHDALEAWEKKREDLFKAQVANWRAWLRTEFPDLSDRQFDRLYEKADGLSTSYAQMENFMGEWYQVFYG